MERAQPAATRQRALTAVLAIGGFYTVLNITLLSPMLKDIAARFAISDARAGQLSTITAMFAFLTALTAAPVISRFPLRRWMQLEIGFVIAASLLTVVAQNFPQLMLARALAGIGGAFILGLCFAAAAESVSNVGQRHRMVGIIAMSATLGVMIGLPLMTLVVEYAGWRWAAALLIPLGWVVLAGSPLLPDTSAGGAGQGWTEAFANYRRMLTNRRVLLLLSAIVVLFGVRFGWLIYYGAYAETVFSTSSTLLGLAFVAGGIAQISAAFLIPRLLLKRQPGPVASSSAIVMTANLAAVGVLYTREWTIFLLMLIGSFTYTACFMALNALLLDLLPSERGAVMSLQSAGIELGIAAGSAVLGATLARLDDYEAAFRVLAVGPPLIVLLLFFVGRSRIHTDDDAVRAPEPMDTVSPSIATTPSSIE